VAFAGAYAGYGQIVIIDHPGGWTSLITGLGTLAVRVGDMLVAGSPMGRQARARRRPVVTLELRKDGQPVNPLDQIGPIVLHPFALAIARQPARFRVEVRERFLMRFVLPPLPAPLCCWGRWRWCRWARRGWPRWMGAWRRSSGGCSMSIAGEGQLRRPDR
jgi:hypothetical protein